MTIKLLSALTPQDRDVTVQVQVNRKWEFRANNADGPILHVDMILTDHQGNAIYAETPEDLVAEKAPLLQVEKVYTIKRFRITKAKQSYRPLDGPLMIYITLYSIINLCHDPPSSFPQYIYRLIPYNNIDPYGPAAKDFHDVLGMITEVSPIETKQLAASSTPSQLRNIIIKDLSDNTIKITLWGEKAQHFSYDSIYEPDSQKPIVVLFVGCLPKDFRGTTYLSGGPACHWYFNPTIQEAESFYNRIASKNIMLQLPPTPQKQLPEDKPLKREDKSLKEILDLGPYEIGKHGCNCTVTITAIDQKNNWWYIACPRCMKSMTISDSAYLCSGCGTTDSTFRYKLTIVASDGTAEVEMFCYDTIAKRIVGRSCSSLIGTASDTSTIPPQLAAIVTQKFTFAVEYTEKSFDGKEKKLIIRSIIASHGRERSLPQVQQNTDTLCPSTPSNSMIRSRSLQSPLLGMSKLSANRSLSTNRMLTYSPVKSPPSASSPKHNQGTQTTFEDINPHRHSTSSFAFESPSKRAKKQILEHSDDDSLPFEDAA